MKHAKEFSGADIKIVTDVEKGKTYTGEILGEHGNYVIQHCNRMTIEQEDKNKAVQVRTLDHIVLHHKDDVHRHEKLIPGHQATITRWPDGHQ